MYLCPRPQGRPCPGPQRQLWGRYLAQGAALSARIREGRAVDERSRTPPVSRTEAQPDGEVRIP